MRKLGLCTTGLLCTKVKLFRNFQNTLDQKCLKNRKLNIANILLFFLVKRISRNIRHKRKIKYELNSEPFNNHRIHPIVGSKL